MKRSQNARHLKRTTSTTKWKKAISGILDRFVIPTVEATIGSLGRSLGTDQRRENRLIQLLEGSDCSLFLWYTILPFPKLPVLPALPAFLAHLALPASPAYSEP